MTVGFNVKLNSPTIVPVHAEIETEIDPGLLLILQEKSYIAEQYLMFLQLI